MNLIFLSKIGTDKYALPVCFIFAFLSLGILISFFTYDCLFFNSIMQNLKPLHFFLEQKLKTP